MAVERKLVTAEELLALPDDGQRRELIDGEVRATAPASDAHGFQTGAIHYYVAHYLRGHPIGWVRSAETGFLLRRDPDVVRAPDLAVVLYARHARGSAGVGFVEGPPDLAVEVVSPNDRAHEVAAKVADWLAAGTSMVWVVYPGPRFEVHRADGRVQRLGADDWVDGADVLPGFSMRVRDLLDPHAS